MGTTARAAWQYLRDVVRDIDLARAPARVIDAAVACYLVFVAITVDVVLGGPLRRLDDLIAGDAWQRSSPVLNHIAFWLDHIGLRGVTATVLVVTATAISVRIGWWRPLRLALLGLVALNLSVGTVKVLTGRTSPREGVDELLAGGFHYVSGHASNAALSWGLVAYLVIRFTTVSGRVKEAVSTGALGATMLMVVVSLYRNTHWITDLLGGVLVGWTLLALVIVVDHVLVRPTPAVQVSGPSRSDRVG